MKHFTLELGLEEASCVGPRKRLAIRNWHVCTLQFEAALFSLPQPVFEINTKGWT